MIFILKKSLHALFYVLYFLGHVKVMNLDKPPLKH